MVHFKWVNRNYLTSLGDKFLVRGGGGSAFKWVNRNYLTLSRDKIPVPEFLTQFSRKQAQTLVFNH
jgi:hypothetical protein